MPSLTLLILGLVASLLVWHADASLCKISTGYSLAADAPTITAHHYNHAARHAAKRKPEHAQITSAAALPTNILKNPGFDEPGDESGEYDGTPAWFQLVEGEIKAATKSLPAVSGDHFLHFDLVEEGIRGSILQDVDGIDTSKRYTVSLWVKVTSEHGEYRDGSCQLDIELGYQRLGNYNLSTTYPKKSINKGDEADWVLYTTPDFAIGDPGNLLLSLSGACGRYGHDIHVYCDSVVFKEASPTTPAK